jgi:hypothetical protein
LGFRARQKGRTKKLALALTLACILASSATQAQNAPPPPINSSNDKQTDGGGKTPALPDQRRSTMEFLTAYDGGDCFLVTPERLSGDSTRRDGDAFGRSQAPFDDLNFEF